MCELPFEVEVMLCHIEQAISFEWTNEVSVILKWIVSKQLRKGLEFWKIRLVIIGCEFGV